MGATKFLSVASEMSGPGDGNGRQAEVVGGGRDRRITDRTMRRWRPPQQGPSPKRTRVKVPEQVLQLEREKYFDFNVQHFHDKLKSEHGRAAEEE